MEANTARHIENTVCSVVLMLCLTFLIKGCMDSNHEYDVELVKAKNAVGTKP